MLPVYPLELLIFSEPSKLIHDNSLSNINEFSPNSDLNLVELGGSDLTLANTVVGNNDEILALAFIGQNRNTK